MVEVHEDKCQTFRKRRLSFSNLVVDADTKTPAYIAEEKKDMDKIDVPLQVKVTDSFVVDQQTQQNHNHSNDDFQMKKAQTFRRRRLSLTNRRSDGDEEDEKEEEEETSTDLEQNTEPGSDEIEGGAITAIVMPPTANTDHVSSPPAKIRRLSSVSVSSRRSSNASSGSNLSSSAAASSSLKTVVVHASELVSQQTPPPSPALVSANRLYDYGPVARRQQQQEQFQQWQQLQQQQQQQWMTATTSPGDATSVYNTSSTKKAKNRPRWQKRVLRHHQEDEGILPFPRDAVGTFSCHGVEPIYENVDPNDNNMNQMKTVLTTTIAKINQDRGGIAFPYAKSPQTALFAVYDGM
jgi:hypothetical protein